MLIGVEKAKISSQSPKKEYYVDGQKGENINGEKR
jgi:hypothetical protein